MSNLTSLISVDTDLNLAGGTVLTANQSQYDTFTANRSLTFSATLSVGGPATRLIAHVTTVPITLTIPSCQRQGAASNPTTTVTISVASDYEFSWLNSHGTVYLVDNVGDETAVGRAFQGLATPAVVSYPRINTDGTVSELTAAQTNTALGLATIASTGAEADLAFTDVTTGNVTTSKHGFVPKAPNDSTKFLDGTGGYSIPAGTAGGAGVSDAVFSNAWDGVQGVAPSKNAVWDTFGSEILYPLSVYAAGTAYSLTNSDAIFAFGTTSPTLVLNKAGTYLLQAGAKLKYNAATFAGAQTATVHLRRTNNTAANVTSATSTTQLRIVTTITDGAGDVTTAPVFYTTANTNDSVSLFGSVSVAPGAGSLDVTEAWVTALKLYGPPAPPPAAGYLIYQNFETPTTGYDNSESWTESGTTIDHAYTAAPLVGSQSLRLSGGGTPNIVISITPINDAWMFFKMKMATLPTTANAFAGFQDAPGTTAICYLSKWTNFSLYSGSTHSTTSACTMLTGTLYNVWIHFVRNGTSTLYVSASTTRPTVDSGTECVQTGSTQDTAAGRIQLYNGAAGDIVFDHVIVSATEIGNNP